MAAAAAQRDDLWAEATGGYQSKRMHTVVRKAVAVDEDIPRTSCSTDWRPCILDGPRDTVRFALVLLASLLC